MAKKTAQVDVKVTGARSIQDIEQELQAVNDQLKSMDVNSQAFKEMSVQAQNLDSELQNVNKQLSFISPAEQADGFLKMGEGILGSVAAVQGLSAAFGGNTEKMEETIKKLVGLVAAMDGVRKVSEALQKENLEKLKRGFQSVGNFAQKGFGAVSKSLEGATKSFGNYVGATQKGVKLMNTALTGFVITAILVALTLAIQAVIKNWDKLVAIFSKSKAEANAAADAIEKITKNLDKLDQQMGLVNTSLDKGVKTLQEIAELNNEDLFLNSGLLKLNNELKTLESELLTLRKGSQEYLQKEVEIAEKRAEQQAELIRTSAIEYKLFKDRATAVADLEFIEQSVYDLMKSRGKLQEELSIQQDKYNAAVKELNRLEDEGARPKKIKQQQELVDKYADAVKRVQDSQNRLNESIEATTQIWLDLSNNTPLNTLVDQYAVLQNQIEDANTELKDFINQQASDKLAAGITELNLKTELQIKLLGLQGGKEEDILYLQMKNNEEAIKMYEAKQKAFGLTVAEGQAYQKLVNQTEELKLTQDNMTEKRRQELDALLLSNKEIEKSLTFEKQKQKVNEDYLAGLINEEDQKVELLQITVKELQADKQLLQIKRQQLEAQAERTTDSKELEKIQLELNKNELDQLKIDGQIQAAWLGIKSTVEGTVDETKTWGEALGEFMETYINETVAELQNLIDAGFDLYNAKREETISQAELEIEKQQEVADNAAELAKQLYEDEKGYAKDKIGLEALLADANAERYAEIQAEIDRTSALEAKAAQDKQVQLDKEKEALAAVELQNKKIAYAEYEIQLANAKQTAIQTAISGALAIVNALASPFPLNIALPIIIGAATAVQIAAAAKRVKTLEAAAPPKAAEGGLLQGASHAAGGIPIEAEGGEYIINKKSTSAFLPLIEAINNSGRPKYADGGQVVANQKVDTNNLIDYDQLAAAVLRGIQPVVSVVEITDKQNRVRVIESNASL